MCAVHEMVDCVLGRRALKSWFVPVCRVGVVQAVIRPTTDATMIMVRTSVSTEDRVLMLARTFSVRVLQAGQVCWSDSVNLSIYLLCAKVNKIESEARKDSCLPKALQLAIRVSSTSLCFYDIIRTVAHYPIFSCNVKFEVRLTHLHCNSDYLSEYAVTSNFFLSYIFGIKLFEP